MTNAECCEERLLADGPDIEPPDEQKAPSPPSQDGEREGALPASLVPPPFEEDEAPFTD